MITREQYVARVELPVGAHPALLPDVLGVAITVPIQALADIPGGTMTMSSHVEGGGKMKLSLVWQFDDFFSDEADASGDTLLGLTKRFGILCLPKDAATTFHPRQVPVLEMACKLVAPAIQSIAVRGRAPEFLQAFWESIYARLSTGSLSVHGEEIPLKPLSHWSRLDVRNLYLGLAEVTRAVALGSDIHEGHVSIADARLKDGDLRGAITNLTTAMEVAAYAMLRRESSAPVPNFRPALYFFVPADSPRALQTYVTTHGRLDADVLERLDSLWGTRHEIVHNGALLMRPARPAAPSPSAQDYYAFRTALSKALVWMGFPAIE